MKLPPSVGALPPSVACYWGGSSATAGGRSATPGVGEVFAFSLRIYNSKLCYPRGRSPTPGVALLPPQ